jgi:hypothetical protein
MGAELGECVESEAFSVVPALATRGDGRPQVSVRLVDVGRKSRWVGANPIAAPGDGAVRLGAFRFLADTLLNKF